MRNKEILIIGAGPAGLVCGKHLLNNGFKVKIIERSTFPRMVVGESLLPISMEHFEQVGFLEDLSKVDWEVKTGATFIQGDAIYEIDFSKQFTENGKEWTWQVPRAEFDQIMADNFLKAGGEIEFGSEVTALKVDDEVSCTYKKGNESIDVTADFLVDSSGLSGVSSHFFGKEIKKHFLNHSSIFCHLKDENMNCMENPKRIAFDILKQDLWLWVIPFHNGTSSVGIVGDNSYFNLEGDAENQLRKFITTSERYKERFEGQEFLFEAPIIRSYTQKSQDLYGKNYCLIGNCAEFLDPIFSSGVAFATGSGITAGDAIINQFEGNEDWEAYGAFMKQGVDVFRDYVGSWYEGELQNIFFSKVPKEINMEMQITSVLAGYVWDTTNPFVSKSKRNLTKLSSFLTRMEENL